MIKSRLHCRRNNQTVDVKVKTRTNSQYAESNALYHLTATKEPVDTFEQATDGGMIVSVTDVFWFEAKAGESLPAIEEKHVLVDTKAVRYEVVGVTDQGGEGDRLRVRTRRLR